MKGKIIDRYKVSTNSVMQNVVVRMTARSGKTVFEASCDSVTVESDNLDALRVLMVAELNNTSVVEWKPMLTVSPSHTWRSQLNRLDDADKKTAQEVDFEADFHCELEVDMCEMALDAKGGEMYRRPNHRGLFGHKPDGVMLPNTPENRLGLKRLLQSLLAFRKRLEDVFELPEEVVAYLVAEWAQQKDLDLDTCFDPPDYEKPSRPKRRKT